MIVAAEEDLDRPRRLLDEVLTRPEFSSNVEAQPDWLQDLIDRIFGAAGDIPGWAGQAVTIAVLVLAVLLIVSLLAEGGGRRRRSGEADASEADGPERRVSAIALYREARQAGAAGRHSEAVVLAFRAMVARLVERGFLLSDPSRTNREHLRDLRARPGEAGLIRTELSTFERVRYGRRTAQPADAAQAMTTAAALFPEEASP